MRPLDGVARLGELAPELERVGDLADVARFLVPDEGDPHAAAARAGGAPDAVLVGVAVAGRIEVDHVADAVDVDAARRHVGRDESVDLARVELARARARAGPGTCCRAWRRP